MDAHLTLHDDKRLRITLVVESPNHFWHHRVCASFPESKWHAEGYFTIPVTEPNLEYLEAWRAGCRMGVTPKLEIDSDAQLFLDYALKTLELARLRERRRWQYVFEDDKLTLDLSQLDGGYQGTLIYADGHTSTYTFRTPPYKHQLVALDSLHNQEFFALLMEMGTGKTKVVIDEVYACSREKQPYLVLVTCPKTLLATWEREIKKHTPVHAKVATKRLRSSVWGIQDLIELVQLDAEIKYALVNYERLTGDLAKGLVKVGFDLHVLDESTRIKNPSAKRTKAAWEVGLQCKRRCILTGSPVCNSLFDLFPQFEFLSPGCLGYSTFYAFKEHYSVVQRVKGWEEVKGYRAIDELKRRVARHSFMVKKVQCLDLPEKVYTMRTVEFGEEQRRMYDQMVELFLASLESNADPSGTVEARAVISQLLRLSQITQGYIKTQTGEEVAIPDGDGKLLELLDLLDEVEKNQKLVVWCRFRFDIRRITEALKSRGVGYLELHGGVSQRDRDQVEERFNNDNSIRVLVGEPGTGGMGLTLLGNDERPCHTVVYYGNDYSLEKRLQSEDRCHRIGQKNKVTYIDLVIEDSVDMHIAAKLQMKRDLSDEMKNISTIRALLLGDAK